MGLWDHWDYSAPAIDPKSKFMLRLFESMIIAKRENIFDLRLYVGLWINARKEQTFVSRDFNCDEVLIGSINHVGAISRRLTKVGFVSLARPRQPINNKGRRRQRVQISVAN